MTYQVGEEVTLLPYDEQRIYYDVSGMGRVATDLAGNTYKIDHVYADGAHVRLGLLDRYGVTRNYKVPNDLVEYADPSKPRVRKLGEVPSEGEHISVDDPRVQWIFEDMGTLATQMGHCGDYDRMADRLGFPGRERFFKVTRDIKGLSATFHVRARSRSQAEAAVAEKFGKAPKSQTVEDTAEETF